MGQKPDKRPAAKVFRFIVIAAFLSLIVNLSFTILFNSLYLRSFDTDLLPNSSANRFNDNELSDSVLIDSILAIVQSYYVDDDRVLNGQLLNDTLTALAQNPEIKLIRSSDRLTIATGDQEHTVRLTPTLSYRALLSNFLSIAAMIDAKAPAMPATPDSGWAGRGSVMLLNAMLSSLDAHSALLSPSSYRDLKQGTEGSFGGLGVLVGIRDQLLTVIKPLPQSPAIRAGIKRNDRILNINGMSTYGYTLDQLVDYMRGAPGSVVDVGLLQDGDASPKLLKMKREIIRVDSVTSQEVAFAGHKFLRLQVESFSSRTSDEVKAALRKFYKKKAAAGAGVILDLRTNPGGLLEQAVKVADIFLSGGTIVSTKGRREEIEVAHKDGDFLDFPIVVIINGESASASEIVAGALQDHGRAVIVGEPSFGKGSVQTIFELPGEQALKLTIARYYTPLGRSIQNVGIIPDIWLQSIYPEKDNENLLGMFRYRNEPFLKNHLVAAKIEGAPQGKFDEPAFKDYYLNKRTYRESIDEQGKADPELALANTILAKVAKTYGPTLPKSARRASHWLALASPELKTELKNTEATAVNWLRQTHSVDWSAAPGPAATTFADLSLVAEVSGMPQVEQGEEVEVPWTLQNKGTKAIDHVSVFIGSMYSSIENYEFLVGKVEPGHEKKGRFKFKIPTYVRPSVLNLEMGIAQGAIPRVWVDGGLQVRVLAKSAAKLRAEVVLVDDGAGKVANKLEPGEKAQIKVTISNDSGVEARAIKAAIVNLSGRQVFIKGMKKDIDAIAPGSQSTLFVDIEGNREIISEVIDLGLSLESKDLLDPVRQNVKVPSMPNVPETGVVGSLSH